MRERRSSRRLRRLALAAVDDVIAAELSVRPHDGFAQTPCQLDRVIAGPLDEEQSCRAAGRRISSALCCLPRGGQLDRVWGVEVGGGGDLLPRSRLV
jgi:hypothetical protein